MAHVPQEPGAYVYEYGALPSPTSIRLIRLVNYGKGVGPRETKISITIENFELSEAPPFSALSYTWGDSRCPYLDENASSALEELYNVDCDGFVLHAQPNLFAALEMLNTMSIPSTEHIWIDAICINQTSLAERASQVQLMGNLYQTTTMVIVWLGPEDSTISDALVVVERLSSISAVPRSKEHLDEMKATLGQLGISIIKDRNNYLTTLGIEPITDRQWLAWVALLHRPYFQRMWVIQEIALARSLTVVCGRKTIGWEKFSAAAYFFNMSGLCYQYHTEVANLVITDRSDRQGFENLLKSKKDAGITAIQLVKTREAPRVDAQYRLEQLLTTHRFCQATDPRDKIYSLLGISAKDKAPFLDARQAECVRVDYEVPVELLYTKVARMLVESRLDLRILDQRESNRERSIKTLPSWVPDFSVRLLPSEFGINSKFKASGHLEWQPDGREYSDPLLNVQGYSLGVVKAHARNQFDAFQTPLWGSICEVACGLSDYYYTTDQHDHSTTRAEALARTCVADSLNGQFPAPASQLIPQFIAHVATLIGTSAKWYLDSEKERSRRSRVLGKLHMWMIRNHGLSLEGRISPWLRLFGNEKSGSALSAQALIEQVGQVAETERLPYYEDYRMAANFIVGYRVVFRTSGGLLGVGPVGLNVGDEIWVLAGAVTPVLLRRKKGAGDKGSHGGQHHEYLGAAYVHGMMNGEAIVQGATMQDIILE